MVQDGHLAEDVSQGVFLALAQNAAQLTERPVISGWLHRTAQNLAANVVRGDVRRRAREQEAAIMHELAAGQPDADWKQVAPHLDEALGELNEGDRDALMLRYFERKSAQEMAQTLGISDEAAQKRVSRAVERLRESLAKKGITAAAAGIVATVSANAVQAAPAGLAISISTAASSGAVLTTATATKAIAMTAIAKTAAVTTLIVAALAAIPLTVQHNQSAQAETDMKALQQQIAAYSKTMEGLSNQLAVAKQPPALAKDESNELQQLRAEVQSLRQQLQGAARTAAQGSQPTTPSAPTNFPQVLEAPTVPMIAKSAWTNAGDATPESAFQTLYWAIANHDTNTFSRTLAWEPDAKAKCEALFAESPASVQQQFGSIDGVAYSLLSGLSPMSSYGIVSNYASGDNSTLLEQHQYEDGRVRQTEVTFHRFDDGWRLMLGDDRLMRGFDAALKRAAAGGGN